MLAFPIVSVPIPVSLAILAELTERNTQDLELLKRIQRRDERALAALYDQYGSMLYTVALRIVSVPPEAEEVVQEIFAHAWNKSNLYVKERGSVYSWLFVTCRSKAVDRVRAKRFKQQSKEMKPSAPRSTDLLSSGSPPLPTAVKEYRDAIAAAKSKLSDVEIQILDLSYFGGYSQTEVSQILAMPHDTVKAKLRQAMAKLRQAVTKDSGEATVATMSEPSQTQQEQTSEADHAQHRSRRRRRGRRGGRNRRRGGHGGGHTPNSGQPQGGEGGPAS